MLLEIFTDMGEFRSSRHDLIGSIHKGCTRVWDFKPLSFFRHKTRQISHDETLTKTLKIHKTVPLNLNFLTQFFNMILTKIALGKIKDSNSIQKI